MSRNPGARKQAKKARRTKRRAHRDARWQAINTELNAMAEQVASAAKRFDAWITSRGWIIDADNATDEVVSWVYPPSAAEVPPDAEQVTRVWIAIVGEEDDFPRRVSAAVVGTDGHADGHYVLSPDALVDRIETLEAYRAGGELPVLD
ncbi:MAG: hypothetical protein FGM50_02205 [Mycobacterium sp.]|nr:hypothetical protein [Mycobacterium sp.]